MNHTRNNSDESDPRGGRYKVSQNMNNPYYISQWVKNSRNESSKQTGTVVPKNKIQIGLNSPNIQSEANGSMERKGFTIGGKLIMKNVDSGTLSSKRKKFS